MTEPDYKALWQDMRQYLLCLHEDAWERMEDDAEDFSAISERCAVTTILYSYMCLKEGVPVQ
jgi:hypothetical protein